jgi:hypothetical protein
MLVALCTKASTRTIRVTAEECIDLLVALCTKAKTRTIRGTAKECIDMLMVVCTKASTRTVRCTAEECIDMLNGKMHGRGVCRYADGSIAHDGQWKDGQLVK